MGIFLRLQNFKIFLGMPDISDSFFWGGGGGGGGNSRCWVQAYVRRKIESTPWGVFGYIFILLL